MEQPPGSVQDLQPQDLSTVIDLTRKGGEECVLNPASFDALRMVTSPGWYPDPGAADPGLQYSETGPSDAVLQAGPQIQPDNAFSQTTVTLSYWSRSHVFSTHDSLSHSPLDSMPPISKFSLHPSCDSDKGLAEGGFALNQRYLMGAEAPVDQTGLLQSLPQAEAEACPGQEFHGFNGEVVPSDGDVAQCVQGEEEHVTSLENNKALENGQGESWSSSGVCIDSSPETLTPVTGEEEVSFVMSNKGGGGVGSESVGAGDLCPIRGEYMSPPEDPASPSATSLDDVEDLFVLPQASCSPSGDHSSPSGLDGSSPEGDARLSSGTDEGAAVVTLHSRQKNKRQAKRRKALLEPLIDLTDDVCLSDLSENNTKTVVPHVNGNTKTLDRTLKERKLPVRSGRGTRLEAIVMNINSSKYKVSGCIRSNKKPNASQPARSDSSLSSPKRKVSASAGKQKGNNGASFTVTTPQTRTRRGPSNHLSHCKGSTSHPENITNSNKSHCSPSPRSPRLAVHARPKREAHPVAPPPPASPPRPKRKPSSLSSSPLAARRMVDREPERLPHSELSEETHPARLSPPPPPPPPPPLLLKSPKKSQGKAKSESPCSKTSPTAKTKALRAPKRRRKKQEQNFPPSMFSPKEPEIKLKYISYKEEKRDPRLDSFSPYIRVERQQATPSLCTLVNYPDEVKVPHGKAQQHHPQAHSGGFISAAVPSTSCLLLGRVSMHSHHQRSLICCICGHSANAMDLGDLHGPYYPEGYRPNTKAPADAAGLKEEEDSSDSDSSSYSLRGCARKCGALPAPRTLRPGAQLKQKVVHADHHRWCGDSTSGPAAKRARSDPASANAEDWYSPPVLPLEPCEYWLHEDCCIWSAGVFLVKGKVYGLEEAAKVALQTVCSACHHPGATLGCFFKGCPNKYHYRCALESDCVLIEENFSMKCKKHKNKTFKGAPGKRPDVS